MKNLKLTLVCALITLMIAGCGSAGMENPPDQPRVKREAPAEEESSVTEEPERASTYADYKVLAIQSSTYEQDALKDYVITSMSEFERFQELYPRICERKDFMETFHTEIKGYFIDNTLVCHIETVGSGSISFEITGVRFDENNAASIEYDRIDPNGTGTCDVATWFMFAEIPNDAMQPVEVFTDQELKDESVVDDEILLVVRKTNYAWGFYDSGYVIDGRGRIFTYENNTPRPLDGEGGDVLSLAEYLDEIRKSDQSEPVFDEDFIQKVRELGANLSPEDEFKEKHKMYDYGQNTIYYFDPETRKLLKCQSTGDVDQTPKNKSAKKIVNLLNKEMRKNSKEMQ